MFVTSGSVDDEEEEGGRGKAEGLIKTDGTTARDYARYERIN